ATWASVAGFFVALADNGGACPTLAASMGAVTVAGALAAVVGGLAGGHAAVAIVTMALWTGVCGFVGVYGPLAAGVGGASAVIFAVAGASPVPSTGDARRRRVPIRGR